jgi:hypothetical protein
MISDMAATANVRLESAVCPAESILSTRSVRQTLFLFSTAIAGRVSPETLPFGKSGFSKKAAI